VTDAGLTNLKGMVRLKELNLEGTAVTDAGLEDLKGLTNLQSLDLYRTKVTDEGVENLQRALPHCKINREPPTHDGR
jgi:Leucine-rich repeat (LRR) protein